MISLGSLKNCMFKIYNNNLISNNNFDMEIIHSSSTHLTFLNVIYRKMLMMKKNSKTFNRASNTSNLILMGY